MKMLRHQAAAALASAMLIAAGCTPALESAQSSSAHLAPEGIGRAMTEAGDGIRELTLRVDWAGIQAAPVIQGF